VVFEVERSLGCGVRVWGVGCGVRGRFGVWGRFRVWGVGFGVEMAIAWRRRELWLVVRYLVALLSCLHEERVLLVVVEGLL
jgi:hypothetical protein